MGDEGQIDCPLVLICACAGFNARLRIGYHLKRRNLNYSGIKRHPKNQVSQHQLLKQFRGWTLMQSELLLAAILCRLCLIILKCEVSQRLVLEVETSMVQLRKMVFTKTKTTV